ncbi:MAG: SoxR reducing system RseC family protein [Candidatus Omnitrophota bacterium]|nr:SoxR reducing system RseC family protein [Candidatus Omnitrophota bacterium]
MLKETVEVIDVTDTTIRVKFQKRPMCSCCKSTHICNVDNQESLVLPNPKNIAVKKGDSIEVGIEEGKNALVLFIIFLIPAVFFLLFLILTRNWSSLASFSVAILGLMLYYLIVKIIMKNKEKKFNFQILRKI